MFFLILRVGIGRPQLDPVAAHLQRNDYSFGIYIYHWLVLLMLRGGGHAMRARLTFSLC